MPVNKNALARYKVLDSCFRDTHRYYTIDDLVDEVNTVLGDISGAQVSLRQIRQDIRTLRERDTYHAPIVAEELEGRKCYYRYSDPDFSIFRSELTPEDTDRLAATISMLNRYRGVANRWLEEVISNLEVRFGIKASRENIVSFDSNDRLRGLEFLSDLIDAAVEGKPLLLRYRTYSGRESEEVIHPYHLHQFNNRWFLFGLEPTPGGGRIANRALDRIVSFKPADVEFIPNRDIDFEKYFEDIVGVTMLKEATEKVKVVLRFTPERFPYAVSKPIHQSQQVLSEEDCTVQIEVRPNKELYTQIFSYFPDVEVLSPEAMRAEVRQKIEENLRKYNTTL